MTRLRSTLVEFEAVQPDGSTHPVQVNPRFIAAISQYRREFVRCEGNEVVNPFVPEQTTLIQMAGGCTEHIVRGAVDEVVEKLSNH